MKLQEGSVRSATAESGSTNAASRSGTATKKSSRGSRRPRRKRGEEQAAEAEVVDDAAALRALEISRKPSLWTHVPIIFDPVEDRIRLRFLTMATVTLVVCIAAALFIAPNWGATSYLKTEETLELLMYFQSSDPYVITQIPEEGFALQTRVTNHQRWLFEGRSVEAKITGRVLAQDTLETFPYCAEWDVEGPVSLDQERYRTVCSAAITGTTAISNVDGVATFSDLVFSHGLPGSYRITFSHGSVEVSTWVTVSSFVWQIQDETTLPSDMGSTAFFTRPNLIGALPTSTTAGSPTVSVKARIATLGGAQLEGHHAVALALSFPRELGPEFEGFIVQAANTVALADIKEKNVILSSDTATTDDTGLVSFDGLRVEAYASPKIILAIVCEGSITFVGGKTLPAPAPASTVLLQYLLVAPPFNPAGDPLRLEERIAPPTSIVEGESFQFAVQLLGALIAPNSAGRFKGRRLLAFAEPTHKNTVQAPLPLWQEGVVFKSLYGAVSDPIGDDGTTSFSRASMSLSGPPGAYRIRVEYDGTVLMYTTSFTVTTSVATVLTSFDTTTTALCAHAHESRCGWLRMLRKNTDALPAVYAFDKNGKPLRHKRAVLQASIAGDTTTIDPQRGIVTLSYDAPESTGNGLVAVHNISLAMQSVFALSRPEEAADAQPKIQLSISVDGIAPVDTLQPFPPSDLAVPGVVFSLCGTPSCGFIRIIQSIPHEVFPATLIRPIPVVQAFDLRGYTIAGTICLLLGNVSEGATPVQCKQSSASGLAIFDDLKLPSRNEFLDSAKMLLWRFVVTTEATPQQQQCLESHRMWQSSCSSTVHAVYMHPNNVTALEAGAPWILHDSGYHHTITHQNVINNGSRAEALGFRFFCYGALTVCFSSHISEQEFWPSAGDAFNASIPVSIALVQRLQVAQHPDNTEMLFRFNLQNAVPGILRFRMNTAGTRTSHFYVHVRSPVAYIQFNRYPTANPNAIVRVGKPLPQVTVISVRDQAYLASESVVLKAELIAETSFGTAEHHSQLRGNTTAVSDRSGLVRFPTLWISAAFPGVYHLTFTVMDHGHATTAAPMSVKSLPFVVNSTLYAEMAVHPLPVTASSGVSAFLQPPMIDISAQFSDGSNELFSTGWVPPKITASVVAGKQSIFKDTPKVLPGAIPQTIASVDSKLLDIQHARATFDVNFKLLPAGYYYLQFSAPGLLPSISQLANSRDFLVTSRAYRVEVVVQVPTKVVVGRVFSVSVRVLTASGVPLSGVPVRAVANVNLDDPVAVLHAPVLTNGLGVEAVGTTRSDGVATIPVAFAKASVGQHQILFKCNDAESILSSPIEVQNTVAQVHIEKPLAGTAALGVMDDGGTWNFQLLMKTPEGVDGAVLVSSNEAEATASMDLPKLKLVDPIGRPILFSSVSARVFPRGENVSVFMSHSPSEELGDGEYALGGFRFNSDLPTGYYRIEYDAQGVIVVQEQSLYIRNVIRSDPRTVRLLRFVILLGVLLLIPLMLANIVPREESFVSLVPIVISFAGCLTLTVVAGLWISGEAASYGGASKAPTVQMVTGLMLIFNSIILSVVLLFLGMCFYLPTYFVTRMRRYQSQLLSLIIGKNMRQKEAGDSSNRVHPSENTGERPRRNLIEPTPSPIFDLGHGKGRLDPAGSRKPARNRSAAEAEAVASAHSGKADLNKNAALERVGVETTERAWRLPMLWKFSQDFYFPARLLAGLGISVVGVLVTLALLWSSLNWLAAAFVRVRGQVVQSRGMQRVWASRFDPPTTQMIVSGSTVYYFNDFSGWALLFSVLDAFYPRGPALFANLVDGVRYGNLVGLFLAGSSFLLGWLSTLRHYKRTILLYRANPSAARLAAEKFPVKAAANYIGLQLWCSVVAAILLYLPMTLLCMMALWEPMRTMLVGSLALPFAAVCVCELLMFVYRKWVGKTAVQRNMITKRKRFALYDLVGLYLHFIGGIILALYRVVVSYADFALGFGRLDLSLFARERANQDPAHASFMAMIILDYRYNSPVTSVFVNTIAKELMRRRVEAAKPPPEPHKMEEAEAEKTKAATARHNSLRWRVVFSLWKSSVLRRERTLTRKGQSAADAVLGGVADVGGAGVGPDLAGPAALQDWADNWVHAQSQWDNAEGVSRRKFLPAYTKPPRLPPPKDDGDDGPNGRPRSEQQTRDTPRLDDGKKAGGFGASPADEDDTDARPISAVSGGVTPRLATQSQIRRKAAID